MSSTITWKVFLHSAPVCTRLKCLHMQASQSWFIGCILQLCCRLDACVYVCVSILYVSYILSYCVAPSAVQEALVTLVNGEVNVTWSPPASPNGVIHQYVVQRINDSGTYYQHVAGNLHTTTLSYHSDVLVFIAAINLYGQSRLKHAKPKGIHDNNVAIL